MRISFWIGIGLIVVGILAIFAPSSLIDDFLREIYRITENVARHVWVGLGLIILGGFILREV